MVKIRSPEELRAAYEIQLRALEASCANYDAGQTWEAMRLATTIYVLVNDGGRKNQSLVTRLGLRRALSFLATGQEVDDSNAIPDQPLVSASVTTDGTNRIGIFLPLLGAIPQFQRKLRFGQWWDRDLVYRDGRHNLTRKGLVFALRNQEGGSHFDHLDDESYIRFSTVPSWTFNSVDGQSNAMLGAERATMRQIAWELLESLKGA